ncbi:hypothetical protein B0A52_05510 [Exophiala mesophila]|uniref:VPS37 C-terminal domain-containing protein n=1 Tax=Exophiala mesophila TaxID=212818 RepID=A0A438N363_EXOME|nr:hypothetical protein B0A52_05510 [Exophiala mesophila]
MSESFYTSSPAAGFPPSTSVPPSPVTATPPPPPPKPPSHSRDPSRTGTPALSSTPTGTGVGALPFSTQAATHSPRPQPPIPVSSPHSSSTPLPSSTQQQQPQHTPIPPPTLQDRWLPSQVTDKPITELQSLLNNPTLIASLASTHPSYASSMVPLQNAIQGNIQVAQQVSQLEAQVRKLRDETAQLMLNHTSLQTQWRRKQTEMDDALAPWGPRQMYQRLLSSISEQENLLKAIQESFLDGTGADDVAAGAAGYYGGMPGAGGGKASEKEVSEWVRRIREGATTLERRREMRARWDEGRVGGWR